MDKLKLGLIGLGGQGRAHANAILRSKTELPYQLIAVCDVRPEMFGEISVDFNISAGDADAAVGFGAMACYTDADEMLAKEKLDMVIIAVPTYLHCEMTVKALRAGVHVLCEKPMAMNLEQCDLMLSVARECGKQLMIGQCMRFEDEWVLLADYVRTGKLGPMRAFISHRGGMFPSWGANNWFAKKELCGGSILDQHIHDVDYIQYLFGTPDAVSTLGKTVVEGSGYDTICTNYVYENGPMVFAHDDWTLGYVFKDGYRANFEQGTLEWSEGEIKLYRLGEKPRKIEYERTNGLTNETVYFAECINGEHENELNPPEASRETIRIALAEIRSADNFATPIKL